MVESISVLAAGYEQQTFGCFLGANEGMPRRFPNIIFLKKFTPYNLNDILVNNILEKWNHNKLQIMILKKL